MVTHGQAAVMKGPQPLRMHAPELESWSTLLSGYRCQYKLELQILMVRIHAPVQAEAADVSGQNTCASASCGCRAHADVAALQLAPHK